MCSFFCSAAVNNESMGRARWDQLSYRWFARSNVSGVNSVNLMANWLAMCCRLGGSGLVFQWLRSDVDSVEEEICEQVGRYI